VAKPLVVAELDFEAALSRSRDNHSVLIIDADPSAEMAAALATAKTLGRADRADRRAQL